LNSARAHYSHLGRADARILDDILIYRLDDDDYMVVVNASNAEKDANWLQQHLLPGIELDDSSDVTALLALQGPGAQMALQPLAETPLHELRRFRCVPARVAGIECLVSRTGYT